MQFSIAYLTLLVLSLILRESISEPIQPRLELRDTTTGNVFTVRQKEAASFVTDLIGSPLIWRVTNEICAVGIWQFYSGPNFQIDENAPEELQNGITLGNSSQGMWCTETPEEALYLATNLPSMRSYKRLGPDDLNAFSITLYEGPYFTEAEKVFTNLTDYFFADTAIPDTVGSFLITGKSEPEEENPKDLSPVFKVFYDKDDPAGGSKRCLKLVNNAEDGNRATIYHSKQNTESVVFSSFFFFKQSTMESIPGICEGNPEPTLLPPIDLPPLTL